jgi:3-hydroxyisobutyrate dehydrogenase/2-hydroxy-3-oxopropionate reductase
MGSAVTEQIATAGYDVIVWNRTREKADAMREYGVRVADTAADAIREAELVWVALDVYGSIEAVLMTDDVRAALSDTRVVSQTATRPSQIAALNAFVADAGGSLAEVTTIAVPMIIRSKGAVVIYAGPDLEAWRPVLDTFSETIKYQGEVGSVSHFEMAILVNTWAWVYAAFTPLACLTREGIDLEPTLYVMQNTPMYHMPGFVWWGEKVKNRDYDDVQFTVELTLSHIDEGIAYLQEVGISTEIMRAFRKYVVKAVDMGLGKKDASAIFEAMVADDS